MMTKYVAFLRGIAPMNPNMRNEKLRGVMEGLGFSNVRTVISSGNVLFESAKTDKAALEAVIEAAWSEKLGFTSTTIIRSLDELKELAARNPFDGYEHSPQTSLNVTFLKRGPHTAEQLAGHGFTVLTVSQNELCAVINTTTGKTATYMIKAERAYGKEISTRTWKTVERVIKALDLAPSPRP